MVDDYFFSAPTLLRIIVFDIQLNLWGFGAAYAFYLSKASFNFIQLKESYQLQYYCYKISLRLLLQISRELQWESGE